MNVFVIILISALAIFTTWLIVDTVIYFVKKAKIRKQQKENQKFDDSNK